MLRGRMSGAGAPFNVGEMTVTRCSVVLSDGTVGHGYVGGSDARHAEIAALCDALLQTEAGRGQVEKHVIAPLAAVYEARRQRTASRERQQDDNYANNAVGPSRSQLKRVGSGAR